MDLRLSSGKNFNPRISASEMIKISHKISRDFSPVEPIKVDTSNIKLTLPSQELLRVSQNINLYYAPKIVSVINKLTLLAVDPRHLYIYWNLANSQAKSLLQPMYNNDVVLRIYSEPKQDKINIKPKPFIEIPIHTFQSQRKISIPKTSKHTTYSADIGNNSENNNFTSLVESNDLHVYKESKLFTPPTSHHDNDVDIQDSEFHPVDPILFSTPVKSHYASTNHSGLGHKDKDGE